MSNPQKSLRRPKLIAQSVQQRQLLIALDALQKIRTCDTGDTYEMQWVAADALLRIQEAPNA